MTVTLKALSLRGLYRSQPPVPRLEKAQVDWAGCILTHCSCERRPAHQNTGQVNQRLCLRVQLLCMVS